jgi:hypothetical protein
LLVAGGLCGLDREASGAASKIIKAERNAVHHDAIERRLIAFGDDRLPQYATNGDVD